jgi:hypothetical protein
MKLGILRFFALVLLLPGLAGLVANAMLSTHYYDTLPRVPQGMNIVPHTLNGQVVYLTADEEGQLNDLRYYGMRCFLAGVGLGLLYLGAMAINLERWRSSDGEDDED